MTWHTLESIRERWADAPYEDDILDELLEVAKIQVLAYAPALAEDATIPVNYRMAQQVQARNVWNAAVQNADGGLGPDGFVIPTRPLDWHVQQLLRPKRGVPAIG